MMDPQARQDCLKEVRILQNLEHPNIVKCFNSYIQVRQRVPPVGRYHRLTSISEGTPIRGVAPASVRGHRHQRGGGAGHHPTDRCFAQI